MLSGKLLPANFCKFLFLDCRLP